MFTVAKLMKRQWKLRWKLRLNYVSSQRQPGGMYVDEVEALRICLRIRFRLKRAELPLAFVNV